MRKTDVNMRKRTVEELSKISTYPPEIARQVGCPDALARYWMNEEGVPSHYYLKRLYELGCDILYIITGVRQHGNPYEK